MSKEQDILKSLAGTRGTLESIEARWKTERAYSRHLCLELLFTYEYPLSKVSRLSGHHRQTLRVWARRAIADGQFERPGDRFDSDAD